MSLNREILLCHSHWFDPILSSYSSVYNSVSILLLPSPVQYACVSCQSSRDMMRDVHQCPLYHMHPQWTYAGWESVATWCTEPAYSSCLNLTRLRYTLSLIWWHTVGRIPSIITLLLACIHTLSLVIYPLCVYNGAKGSSLYYICVTLPSPWDRGIEVYSQVKMYANRHHCCCIDGTCTFITPIHGMVFNTQNGVTCPTCKKVYGIRTGDMPDGTMHIRHTRQSLPGHEGHGTIEIVYNFSPGVHVSFIFWYVPPSTIKWGMYM